HGVLRPWKVMRCTRRGQARLAELFIAAKLRQKPDANEAELTRERDKAEKPPVLLAMLATPKPAKGEITEAEPRGDGWQFRWRCGWLISQPIARPAGCQFFCSRSLASPCCRCRSHSR